MFQSGEDALSTIGMEIEKAVKAEFDEEVVNQRSDKDEESRAEQNSVSRDVMSEVLTTQREKAIHEQINSIGDAPIPISANLRNDLVDLIQILERNGNNSELLEKVKQDLEFFDNVVLKATLYILYLL